MLSDYLVGAIVRDLKALGREVEAYPDDASLWKTPPGIANSGGTLALHLCGNVQHFFGAVLGGSGYVRDRAAEFNRRDVPRSEIAAQIQAAIAAAELGLAKAGDAVMARDYPEQIAGHTVVTGEWLVHLVAHLGYHLGQVDYHRRLVTGKGETVRAMAAPELRTARKQ
ncbi:MAG TPA: DinB family protein [Gemmatimonadales bacterium]|nr:DinB family protein [Gemmatimonadales bacterium]